MDRSEAENKMMTDNFAMSRYESGVYIGSRTGGFNQQEREEQSRRTA